MTKTLICFECLEEYNPLITEDDCGLCIGCVSKHLAEAIGGDEALDDVVNNAIKATIDDEDLDYEFFGKVLA